MTLDRSRLTGSEARAAAVNTLTDNELAALGGADEVPAFSLSGRPVSFCFCAPVVAAISPGDPIFDFACISAGGFTRRGPASAGSRSTKSIPDMGGAIHIPFLPADES